MKNYFALINVTLLVIGLLFEIFSFLLFQGLFANLNYECGSACEIWPGIPTSQVCIEMCVPRNGYYILFFMIGIILIVVGIVELVIHHFR